MKNYDTFKQYMKQIAAEYIESEVGTKPVGRTFYGWLRNLPEPEKKEEKRWKPNKWDIYFIPDMSANWLFTELVFTEALIHTIRYERGLCCKTPQEAITLAERMLEAIKN